MQPQKFLTFSSTNWNIIEKIFRDELSVFFLLKMTSRTCFFGSGMKIIFHWKAQLFISFGSLVRSLACLLGILTVENRDASLAKNVELHWRLSDKSLLHVRNKRTKHPKERCVKSVLIRNFFWSTFFHIRTEYSIFLRIQSECGKIRIRKTKNTGTFQAVVSAIWLSETSYWPFLYSSIQIINRTSPPEVFIGKDVVKICSKFTGEHPCRNAISIKLQSDFIEITLRRGCSPKNLLHISYFWNISGGLLFFLYSSF